MTTFVQTSAVSDDNNGKPNQWNLNWIRCSIDLRILLSDVSDYIMTLWTHWRVFASNIQTVRELSVSASSILARRPCWRVFLLIYPPLLSAGLHGRLTSCSPNLRPTSGRAHNSAAGISRQLHCAGIPFSVDARALPAPVSYYDAPFSRIFPSRGAHEYLSRPVEIKCCH